MKRILIVNDDGYLSPGLYLLYDAVTGLGEVRVYSTSLPRSAVAHTISFDKPLRVTWKEYMWYRVCVTDGSPIDALHIALALHGYRPDLVLTGVNVGENLSLQHIFYSGTLAVAMEAALHGIPAAAFSADVQWFSDFNDPVLRRAVAVTARIIAEHILGEGLPEGVDLLSVNIPSPRRLKPCCRVAPAAKLRWRPRYVEGRDTRGRPYYWLTPSPLEAPEGSDVYYFERGCIVVTPLAVDLNPCRPPTARSLLEVAGRVEEMLSGGGFLEAM